MENSLSQRGSTALEASSPCITSDRFAVLWARVCSAYPRQETTTATAEVFFESLRKYPENRLTDAVAAVIESSKWFPTVADIIDQIKGDKLCPHNFLMSEIRMQRAELNSREAVLEQNEHYQNERLKAAYEKIAQLEQRTIELYQRDKEMIEQVELPAAQAQLSAVKDQIVECERILAILRQKVKLFDQARILQADQ